MRSISILSCLALAGILAGCSLHIEAETSEPLKPARYKASMGAPKSAAMALGDYYRDLDIELPSAGKGAPQPASDAVITRIAMGSCQSSWKPIPILNTISEEQADLFLYLGDNVYGDERAGNATLPNLRKQYADLAALPEFQKLRKSTPMMVTWDDHDYGLNDAGGDFAFKSFAEKIFLEFWDEPADSNRRKREGVYDARIFGVEGKKVQIIMLDTRYFRSSPLVPTDERGAKGKERYLPSYDPDMTILGKQQWSWFADQLQEDADIRLIVTSIQVLAADHGWEAWHEIVPERNRFFDTVRDSGAKGVVVISGDRHISAFYKKEDVTDYPLYEFTSSSLNMGFASVATEMDSLQLGEAYAPENYGMFEIDWDARTITMQVKTEDGAIQRELGITFDEIGL